MKRVFGAVLLALYLVLVYQKTQVGLAAELFWLSHVTSAMLAMGLLAGVRLLIATGFLFHLAVALPAYVFYLATGGETSTVSFLLHLLSPLFGAVVYWRARLPRGALMFAYLTYAVVMSATLAFTPPAMNVNAAFQPWVPLPLSGVWALQLFNALQMLAQTGAAFFLWNRLARTPT